MPTSAQPQIADVACSLTTVDRPPPDCAEAILGAGLLRRSTIDDGARAASRANDPCRVLVVLGSFAILVMLFLPKGVWGEIAWRWGIRLFPTQRVLSRNSCGSDLAK
jgi:hypothetical protein